jgi:hypothetical protein
MNGSTENAAHGAFEKPGRRETLLNLATAQRMLSLVQRIVADILRNHRRLAQLLPEQTRLHRQRRTLTWPERSRRYQVQEEVAAAEREVQDAVAELGNLGVALLDADEGRVGFPTVVNGRRAFFSWRHGEKGVRFWHFPEEAVRQPIPAAWEKSADMSLSAR